MFGKGIIILIHTHTHTQGEDDAASATTSSTTDEAAVVEIENVRVVVRVRPMDKSERAAGNENVVRVEKGSRCITVTKPHHGTSAPEPPKIYYFDNVFGADSSQVSLL